MTATSQRVRPTAGPYFVTFVEGRRGEILDAALAVFGEKGYEAGTMREIASRVGVTEPAIYRHYDSKEAILSEIVALAGDRIAGQMVSTLDALSAADVAAGLLRFIEQRRGMKAPGNADIMSPGGVLHILFHAAPHSERFLGLFRQHIAFPMIAAVRAAIPRVDAGLGITRSPEEVDAKVRVFMSLFVGYFSTSLMFDAPAADTAIVDALLSMMGWRSA